MEGWVRVCASGELLPGEFKLAYDGDTAIAVFNIDGELYAIEDVCTHDGGELAGGPIEGYEIECLRHGARFDLRTGAALSAPAYTPTTVFPVRREDGAGYFGMFSVVPNRQGTGIGKTVLAEAERIVREHWQCDAMRMTVIDVREELIAFYERRGYVRTGIKKPFPYGDARFGLPKRDDLRFEVLEKPLRDEARA